MHIVILNGLTVLYTHLWFFFYVCYMYVRFYDMLCEKRRNKIVKSINIILKLFDLF